MRSYYSQRTGTNPNPDGIPLVDIKGLFLRVYEQLREDGYFAEAFGFECVDTGYLEGTIRDVELTIMLAIRKKGLWPIQINVSDYSEDDFFDIIEFLFQYVSKPIKGTYHSWGDCGMHWESFNQMEGRREFRHKINGVLSHYAEQFELSPSGDILRKPEAGLEPIYNANVPSSDSNVTNRLNAAILSFRRHSLDGGCGQNLQLNSNTSALTYAD